MVKHNLVKKLSIGIASLALICPLAMSGLNNTNVNAKRRIRTHRVYRRSKRAKRINHKKHATNKRRNKRNYRHHKVNRRRTYRKRGSKSRSARIHMTNGTKADYHQGEKAGHRYGDYYQYRQINYGKAIKGLSRNNKLFNKEYVKGFENSADMTNQGDGPISYDSLIGIAQQYKASHYNPNIIRVVNYLVKKTGGGDGELASSYAKHHPQYRTVANDLANLINFGTL